MSIRTKVLSMVDVIMRVPPILVIDEILKIGMGLPTKTHTADRGDDGGTIFTLQNQTFATSTFSLERYNSSNIISDSSNSNTLNETLLGTTTNNVEYVINSSLEQAIENASVAATTSGIFSHSFNILIEDLAKNTYLSDLLSLTSVKFLLCLLGILCALGVFLLWTRHLVMIYMFVISLGLISLSHWSSVSALSLIQNSDYVIDDFLSMNVTRLLDNGSVACAILPHFAAQWFMGMLFAFVHLGPRYPLLQKSMPLIFTSPIILSIFPLKPRMIKYLPIMADIVPLVLTKITVWQNGLDIGRTVYNGYQFAVNFVANFGVSALIENEWQRLNVPTVLRIFWSIRITQDFANILMCNDSSTLKFLPTIRKLLVNGCETLSAVLGMTAIISALCHYIGKAFQWYLLTYENDEEKSLGTVSAVLFYILALQTGLTSLSPDKRFVRLCRNFCLLFTALLHFLHNIVSPILMSLSAARNPSRKRHFRALTVCIFLISAPVTLLFVLWNRHSPSTWLLAVTAFSIEVVVKVLVSLATYTLFLLDARRQSFWEKLDDYLYYVRAFGNSVEFCFGILLFFNGAWILIFESGGAIRAIMMCIHAYFNIWCEAHAGWSVFMKRRSAVHKISSLPEATPAQLQAFDDVCAICYQEMYSAKITRCRHYFHGVCLRKWLYVQDRCPLCHEIMMHTDRRDETEANSNRVRQHQGPMVALNRNEDNLLDQLPNAPENNDSSEFHAGNVAHNNPNSNISVSPTATVVVAATAAGSRNAHTGLPILHIQD